MAKIHRSAKIQATPEAIWAYLAEPTHWPDWRPHMEEVDSDEPGGGASPRAAPFGEADLEVSRSQCEAADAAAYHLAPEMILASVDVDSMLLGRDVRDSDGDDREAGHDLLIESLDDRLHTDVCSVVDVHVD